MQNAIDSNSIPMNNYPDTIHPSTTLQNDDPIHPKKQSKSKTSSLEVESKVLELVQDRFSIIQKDFRKCLKEIQNLKQGLNMELVVSPTDSSDSVDKLPTKLFSKKDLKESKNEIRHLKASLNWSPLDEILGENSEILKKRRDPQSLFETKVSDPNDKSIRNKVGEKLNYHELNRQIHDLHKKWHQTIHSNDLPVMDPVYITAPKKEEVLGSGDYNNDLLDPDRIQSVIQKKLEQAIFEKVIYTLQFHSYYKDI